MGLSLQEIKGHMSMSDTRKHPPIPPLSPSCFPSKKDYLTTLVRQKMGHLTKLLFKKKLDFGTTNFTDFNSLPILSESDKADRKFYALLTTPLNLVLMRNSKSSEESKLCHNHRSAIKPLLKNSEHVLEVQLSRQLQLWD
jgi:hypothetical protein